MKFTGDEEFVVEAIVAEKTLRGKRWYHVKWEVSSKLAREQCAEICASNFLLQCVCTEIKT